MHLKQTKLDTSVLAIALELLWSHRKARCLRFGCSLTCPPALHFQQRPRKQEPRGGGGGRDGNARGTLSDFWFWVSNFCFLWIPLFEPQSPLAIELWVYICCVLLPHRTSQIYLNRSWFQSAPHEEAPVDVPVENSIIQMLQHSVCWKYRQGSKQLPEGVRNRVTL